MTDAELELERQRLAKMSNTELLAESMAMIERNQQTEAGCAYLAETAGFWAHHIVELRQKAATALRRELGTAGNPPPSS